jgi:hypothetical protein
MKEKAMLTIETIEPGKSYAAKFKIENMPMDEFGRLGGPYSLADLPVVKTGTYEGLGILMQRDSTQKLVKLQDEKSGKEFIVPFSDIWDVDEVEWNDPLESK